VGNVFVLLALGRVCISVRACVCAEDTPLSLSFSLHKSPYLVTYIPSVSAIAPPIQTIMASEGLVCRLWAQRYSWGGPSACLSAPNAACLLRIFCGNQWPSLIFRHHLATTPLFLFPLPPPETFIFLVSTPFFFPGLWLDLIHPFCCGNMSASCLEKTRLLHFPLVRAHLRGLRKRFESRMIPFHSGLIVLSALHTLTHTHSRRTRPGWAPNRDPGLVQGNRVHLLQLPSGSDGCCFLCTQAEVTALDIDLLDLGCHLEKLLLGLFMYGNSRVNFRQGVGDSLIIGREAQGYSSLNLVRFSGFLRVWV